MKGRWVRGGGSCSYLRTADGLPHATVYRVDMADGGCVWIVYTAYTEGNDHFNTEREAKMHARKRLRDLLEATEALR